MEKHVIRQSGQSLVEMIVVIGVVILLTTGIVAGTTMSLSGFGSSQSRSDALTYAQAGIELARKQRDSSWNTFMAMGNPAGTYCVGSDGDFGSRQTTCTTPNIHARYIRSVTLRLISVNGISSMEVTSSVKWGDASSPVTPVQLVTYLTQWR